MRVFITGTGRCGTLSFVKACRHITNYTAGHETKVGRINDLDYPDNHIEVDPHLVWVMPMLLTRYKNAFWVHLWREKKSCVASLVKRESLLHFARFAHMYTGPKSIVAYRLANLHYENVNGMINYMLMNKAGSMHMAIEAVQKEWPIFWGKIGAEGSIKAALQTLRTKYNKSRR